MQQMVDEAGNIWNVDAQGNPVSFAGSANQQRGGGVQIKSADPKQPFVAPQAGADLEGTQLTNEQKRAALMESKYGKLPQGYRWKSDMTGAELIPGVPAPAGASKSEDRMRNANLRSVIDQINYIEKLFNENQKGVGLGSILEYLPTQGNAAFDTAGSGLGDLGTAAFKVPGMGSQSDADAARFVAANQPSRWDNDAQVQGKLNTLRNRVNNTLESFGEQPAQWGAQYAPADFTAGNTGAPASAALNGLPRAAGAQADPGMGPTGVTSEGGKRYEPGLAGIPDAVANMIRQGSPASEVTAFLNEQYAPYGTSLGPDQAALIGALVQRHRENPNAPVKSLGTGWQNLSMLPAQQESTMLGRAADTDVGNFAMNAANAATAELPAYMAGDQGAAVMDAARQSRPLTSLGGEVVGGAAGMLATGGIANAAGRSAIRPLAMAGQALSKSGAVGSDIAFSAARGGLDNGPTGALVGGLAGAVGNKVGSGIVGGVGKAVRGIRDPAVNYLASRGVPMTAGQLLGNRGLVGKTMNKLESMPFVGESLAARRIESMTALNRAAMEDAGRGIGFNPTAAGFEGVESGLASAGNAMDNAVSGVDVPIDQVGVQELRAALNAGAILPKDLADNFATAINNRVAPALDTGRLTGKDYQQAVRGIRGYQAEAPKPGFEADYRSALGGVEDALTGAVTRGAGREVSENLGKANTSYRDFKLLEDAVKKAQGGSASGAQEIFTPAQLQAAVRASKYAKSGTKEPFGDLTRAGQEVLPSTVPNSGTADRAMAMALPGLLGAGAAGVGNYVDPKAAIPLAMLAALSSRSGAKVVQKALTGRSTAARAVGRKIIQQRRKAGLFGASASAAMLPQSSQ